MQSVARLRGCLCVCMHARVCMHVGERASFRKLAKFLVKADDIETALDLNNLQ